MESKNRKEKEGKKRRKSEKKRDEEKNEERTLERKSEWTRRERDNLVLSRVFIKFTWCPVLEICQQISVLGISPEIGPPVSLAYGLQIVEFAFT